MADIPWCGYAVIYSVVLLLMINHSLLNDYLDYKSNLELILKRLVPVKRWQSHLFLGPILSSSVALDADLWKIPSLGFCETHYSLPEPPFSNSAFFVGSSACPWKCGLPYCSPLGPSFLSLGDLSSVLYLPSMSKSRLSYMPGAHLPEQSFKSKCQGLMPTSSPKVPSIHYVQNAVAASEGSYLLSASTSDLDWALENSSAPLLLSQFRTLFHS